MNRPWMLVMIAASALPGCTLFSKKDKVDQRTHVPGEAAKPENPPAADEPKRETDFPEGLPQPTGQLPARDPKAKKPNVDEPPPVASDPKPVDLPPTSDLPPTKAMPEGEFTLSRTTCPAGVGSADEAQLTLKNQGGKLTLQRQLSSTCIGHQDGTSEAEPTGTLALKFTPTTCDGACASACPGTLLGAVSETLHVSIDGQDGRFVMTSAKSLGPTICNAAVPAGLVFTSTTPPPANCAKHWHLDHAVRSDDPLAFEGELRWAADQLKKDELRSVSSTDILSGDFTVTTKFKNFVPGGRGGYFAVKLEDKDHPGIYALAMVGNNTAGGGLGPMVLAGITNDGTFNEQVNAKVGSRSLGAGSFRVAKAGKSVTVTIETDGGKLEQKTSDAYQFSDGKYVLRLEMGNNSTLASLTVPTTIAIEQVVVKTAAGATLPASDEFSCDTLDRGNP